MQIRTIEQGYNRTVQFSGNRSLEPLTATPKQFLGLEINVWAKEVAELVLGIGYLQCQYRSLGKAGEGDVVLQDFHNIEHCDAMLELSG
ncbi:hypothetical protein [Hyphomonas sp.]|uniref:hypothetical protein n=1 Tax=Hyphomonas sp. TaxID=87 RepID=UPI001BCA8668|nr:hypothetical protein [Hyphomonas sp.]